MRTLRPFMHTLLCLVLAGVTAVAGCSDRATIHASAAAAYAKELQGRVSVDAVMAHLQKFQDIANANGGTRLAGTPGFAASVDYVVNTLKDRGFDVQTPEFDIAVFNVKQESLTLNGKPIEVQAVDFSASRPAPGVTGRLVAVPSDDSPGCEPADYDNLPVAGAIVLVDRGTCYVHEKANAASQRGAVGLIVADNVDEYMFGASMSEENDVKIPVVSVSKAEGAKLRTQTGTATLIVDATVIHSKVRNIIAQTKTGATDNVVVVGGHLDSVRQGPGINDDGSGVSAILETAVQMGPTPRIKNAVRFAFWAGEEEGLLGSYDYVRSLDVDELKSIALYLNFDMIGSPNFGLFTLDGNLSTLPDPDNGLVIVPEGSAGIERALLSYLKTIGKAAQDAPFDGRGDYDSFARAGIPVGDLFTGAEEIKSREQVELWGGEGGEAFDPNYHSRGDTVQNVNPSALDITVPAVAYMVGLYSQDQSGRFGVPVRNDRTRHVLEAA